MSYRILTKNSVDNTNIDGARQNHFNASMRSGVVEGALNECNVISPASNQIVINTGELRISGHQVVITESEQMQLTTTPQTATDYSIIAEISVDSLSTPVFRMFIQPQNSGLIQDNLFATLNGVGTYQIKLANFTQNTDGTINNVVNTAELIGGTNDTQSQIDNINNTLNNKANKDLSNVTYPQIVADGEARTGAGDRVIETYISSDGLTWYRKWASGWKECGVRDYGTSLGWGKHTWTYPISFTQKPIVVGSYRGDDSTNTVTTKSLSLFNITTSSVQLYADSGLLKDIYVCGY